MKRLSGKILFFSIGVILMIAIFVSCNKSEHQVLDANLFHDDFKTMENFDVVFPLLYDFFDIVEDAYEASDKVNLSSFVIPEDILKQYSNEIESWTTVTNALEDGEENLKKLNLMYPVLQVNTKIAEGDLLYVAGNIEHKVWFNEMRSVLNDAYIRYYEKGVEFP